MLTFAVASFLPSFSLHPFPSPPLTHHLALLKVRDTIASSVGAEHSRPRREGGADVPGAVDADAAVVGLTEGLGILQLDGVWGGGRDGGRSDGRGIGIVSTCCDRCNE